MSSKFIPPKLLDMFKTVSIITFGSFESMHIGNASISAKVLNSAHFPSITGIPAEGPISPSPSTAVPSVITATRFPFLVYSYARFSSLAISRQGSATPGV